MINALGEALKSQKLDGICLNKKENIFYCTGFEGSFGKLMIKSSGEMILLTDGRYEAIAQSLAKKNGFEFIQWDQNFKTQKLLVLKGIGAMKILQH